MKTKIVVPDFKARLIQSKPTEGKAWFAVQNRAADDTTEVSIYDELGGYGIMAAEFIAELKAVRTGTIELHLNSPGGSFFEGVAIYNALVDHDSKVIVHVDGIAASAASVVAMAGDEIIMKPGSQLMIHDAWGVAMGNAEELRQLAGVLDGLSDGIAEVYALRGGGTAASWRKTMKAEAWYGAEEAVKAGLADRYHAKTRETVSDTPFSQWDLSVFNYAGREHAPAPQTGSPAYDFAGLRNALKGMKIA